MKNYKVWYHNNDGHIVILANNLSYEQAIKAWQKYNTQGYSFCSYGYVNAKGILIEM